MKTVSISPNGKEYQLPSEADSQKELEELRKITAEQRKLGRKIVAVQGMGFVGCVMAAVVADAVDKRGEPLYFVHGQQRASARSFWKVPVINSGVPPVSSSDAEVPKIYHRTVVEKKTLRATWLNYAYDVADIVVVDIQLDATKPAFGDASLGYCDMSAFRDGMKTLGKYISPECLILVETTVPPGTCQNVVKPVIEEEFKKRGIDIKKSPPLIAHSYERVMPGAKYVSSIRDFWRVFSGVNEKSKDIAREFLNNILDTEKYPLTELDNTNADALNYLGYMYAEDSIKLDQAEKFIKQALEYSPNNAAYIDSLGWVYFKQGLIEQALLTIKQAAAMMEDPEVFEHLGDIYQAQGILQQAREAWNNSLKLEPERSTVQEKLKELENDALSRGDKKTR